MPGTAAARQHYRKIEWNPTDMPSPTQITSAPVQPAQQDASAAHSQKTPDKDKQVPRTGSLEDHQGIYSPKRGAALAKSLRANSKRQAAAGKESSPADSAKLAESTGLPQTEQHITAPRRPPAHIQLLDEKDQKRYTDLWTQLPAAREHWTGPRVDQMERLTAMSNIGERQELDAKSEGILQSRLAATEPSKERDELSKFQKQIEQSKLDLHGIWSALQANATGAFPAKATSAA